MRAFWLALSLTVSPVATLACPLSDTAYVAKFGNTLKTRLYFNAACDEVIQNFRGSITRHKLTKVENGWTFSQRDQNFRWLVSPTGRSVRLIGPEWGETARLVKTRKKVTD